MVSRIVEYLNALVATKGSIERMYGMTQRIQYEGKEVPFCYVGNGEFRPIEIDGGSISYWALNGEVQPFEQVDGYKAEKPLKRTFPLRFVAMVRRDDTEPTSYAEDISNLLTGYSNDLRLQLLAQSVNIVAGFDVDSSKIWRSEFAEISQEVNFTRFMVRIDMTVTVVANRACWQNCDTLPDILQGFDWCNPATIERLLPAQIACITEQLCTPPTLCELIEVATAVEVVDCLSDEQYTEVQDIVCEPCAPVTVKLNTVTVATPASGTIEDIDVVNGGANPVGAWDGTSFVIGNNYTEINGVQVTDQEAEVNASIFVTLDGSQSGSWNAGLQRWEVTSPPCSPVTFQINGVTKETPASGSTFNLIATLDGVAGGTYTPATDTLAFTSSGNWVRPSFWPTLPTLTAASEAGYILLPVYENRLNRFTLQINNSTIDWGDGSTSAPSGSVRTKQYDYATLAGTVYVDAQTGENYKFVIIGITRTGAAITSVDFTASAATSPLNAPSYAVDYNLSFPNATTFTMGQLFTREPRMVQILRIWALGTISTIRIGNAVNLRILQLPATMSGSLGAFAPRIGACQIGNVNFGTATGLGSAFTGAMVLSYGNLIANSTTSLGYTYSDNLALEYFGTVTANACTTITFGWSGNFAMKSIGLLTLPLCTDYSYAWANDYALTAIRVANAAACTSTTGMILNCFTLQVLDMPNLTRGVNFTGTSMGNYGMNIFANGIGTASGAQTITITGTPFGVLVTAADATALAIRAVMTGKGYTIVN
jgi:hypothetical protein